MVADYGLSERDAEVVIAAGALFHDTGMSIHRADHEAYSLFLTADKLGTLLEGVYDEPSARSSSPRRCRRSSGTAAAGRRSRSRPASCASPTRST